MSDDDRRELVFLKLGGSLITDKTQVEAVQREVLRGVAGEIARARRDAPRLRLLLGHGSGSFGHVAARKHGTRAGVQGEQGWLGFAQVADAAARLNRLVTAALLEAGVPAWSVQPSAGLSCQEGAIAAWADQVMELALARGLTPLIYGDAALDRARGGTIVSTEELFAWLTPRLRPARIVLAGVVDGVYSADPLLDPAAQPWPLITPDDLPRLRASLGGSHGVDVTGGMFSKVTEMCRLASNLPGLEVRLVSGLRAGAIYHSLLGDEEAGGTRIVKL
ncbi:MAG TPA: isopentenyl phosphate kinase [Anaerolineae bacterium]|nr:isopentenyl phosphate kinase [Anaerolineae bacterium]HNU03913.1 isopentenyl phosphate kinase [Anaerolineae bacterium]